MTALVVGASAGLGRALSVALAKERQNLILVAREDRDLRPLCAHLELTFGVSAQAICVDVADIASFQSALTKTLDKVGQVQSVFLPVGASLQEDLVTGSLDQAEKILGINFLSAVAAVQTSLPYLSSENSRIVGFGSVATIRGRSRNVAYSAAKRALTSYFESLRHSQSDTPVTVQFYQMGYIQTQQLYGQRNLFPAITPERAAALILSHGASDFGSRYLPRFWWVIAIALSFLPWRIFRRLKF